MSALRKVLVVDDDPVVGRSFDRVLSAKGYAVVTAENGEDALKKIQDEAYDLVVTDIKMPGMDGVEVAERVRARQPWMPVVIITGYGTQANEERAKAAGVREFLRKPLSPEMIEDSALHALARPEPEPVALPEARAAPVEPLAPARAGTLRMLRNMALFLSAPFIGLLYAVLMPFVGLGMLAWFAGEAIAQQPWARKALDFSKFLAMVVVGAVVGLAYFLLLPLVGIALLGWTAVRRS
jgi:CheY-like chemotaxis protein